MQPKNGRWRAPNTPLVSRSGAHTPSTPLGGGSAGATVAVVCHSTSGLRHWRGRDDFYHPEGSESARGLPNTSPPPRRSIHPKRGPACRGGRRKKLGCGGQRTRNGGSGHVAHGGITTHGHSRALVSSFEMVKHEAPRLASIASIGLTPPWAARCWALRAIRAQTGQGGGRPFVLRRGRPPPASLAAWG